MFFGNTIRPLLGLEWYFDDSNALCVNKTYMANFWGRYNPNYHCYYLGVVSHSSTTGLVDLLFAFDFIRMKWYQILPTTGRVPQCAFTVEDVTGNKYVYASANTGYMVRLENGLTWGDAAYPITNTVKTADIIWAGSIWDKTSVNRVKLLSEHNAAGKVTINTYVNGETSTYVQVADETSLGGTNRYNKLIAKVYGTVVAAGDEPEKRYKLIALSHAFEFIFTECSAYKPHILGWGVQWQLEHEDFTGDVAASAGSAVPLAGYTYGFVYEFDGGGTELDDAISSGGFRVPYSCTLQSVTILCDTVGDIDIDIWKCTYENWALSSVADTICAATRPTITADRKLYDDTLDGWNTDINAGDILKFHINTCATITNVTINLKWEV
jgi:hypothetical protein